MKTIIRIDDKEGRVEAMADAWREPLFTSEPVRCQIFNSMEAVAQWVRAVPDWKSSRIDIDGWSLPFEVRLSGFGRVIAFDLCGRRFSEEAWEITIANLIEENTSIAKILRIDVLPGYGAARHGEDGNLFLPSYCGILHNFHHSVSRELRMAIYARQEQWPMHCNLNCFGIKTPRFSMCAVVVAGEYDAEVVARSHWESDRQYSVHSGFVYRWAEKDTLNTSDRTVRYFLLSPLEDGWSSYARRYRAILRSERNLRTWDQKLTDHPALEHLSKSFLIKIFQGHKEITPEGTGEYHSCTSFDEAQTILQQMKDDGISIITAQMVGWNCEGHDGRYPQRFPVNETEGGEEGFRRLLQWAKTQNILLSVHDNCYDAYRRADNFDEKDLIVLGDGKIWRNIPWSGGHSYKICPLRGANYLKEDFRKMRELGIDGHYYLDALGAFYPCESSEHPANRKEFLGAMREILKFTRLSFGSLNVEIPFGPFFDIIDGTYLDDNVYFLDAHSDFRKHWIDETVPFLAIALHNSVRYQSSGGGKSGIAKALRDYALGAMPFIEVSARTAHGAHSMPTYESRRAYAQAAWRLSCEQNIDRFFVDIDDINEVEADIWVTQYADGIKTVTNSGERAAIIDGIQIEKLSTLRS